MADKDKIYNSDLPPQDKAAFLIICSAQELLNKVGNITQKYGISLTQLRILDILDHQGQAQVTVNAIRGSMIDDSPNVSRSINKLVEKKLVTKQRSAQDQRVVYVYITDEGRRIHRDCDRDIIGNTIDLPDKDCERISDLMMKL